MSNVSDVLASTPLEGGAPPPADEGKADVVVTTEAPDGDGEGDKGTKFVELPPDVKKRFDRIYANMKEHEREKRLLQQDYLKVAARLERLETERVRSETRNLAAQLQAQIAEAAANGEPSRVAELTTRLVELKVNEGVGTKTAPAQPTVAPQGALTRVEEQTILDWQNEVDDNGQFVRPWAINGHPRQKDAIEMLRTVAGSHDNIDDALAEVDKRMRGPRRPGGTPAVLPTSTERAASEQKRTVRLSEDQRKVARELFNDLPPREAEARYARNLESE